MTGTATVEDRLRALFASDPEAMADPYPLFNELREHGPAFAFDDAILLTRYADVRDVIHDNGQHYTRNRSHLARRAQTSRARMTPAQQDAFDYVFGFEALQVAKSDLEQHDRLRRIAHRAFTPKTVAGMRDSIQRYTDDLLAPLAEQEVCDFAEFAYTLPLLVISDMLGVPHADREQIHEWTTTIARHKGANYEGEPLLDAQRAIGEFRDYVESMLIGHRGASRFTSDLVAALMGAEEEERLSNEELTAMFVVLLFGGHETTTNLLAIGVLELLRRPDQWALLTADPALAGQATEELLRFITPVQWQARVALDDRVVGGAAVRSGDTVIPLLAAANRDPEVFSDPDQLDILRTDGRRHVALGFGPHFCLGASLARMEGTVALGTLARRFPAMELATDTFQWRGSALLRGLAELPVRLGPERRA